MSRYITKKETKKMFRTENLPDLNKVYQDDKAVCSREKTNTEYWYDEYENKWNKENFTFDDFEKLKITLEKCKNCIDCENCTNCSDGVNSINCINCHDFVDSSNCTNCFKCYNCSVLKDCQLCKNSKVCSFCESLENCIGCINCFNCKNCKQCRNCNHISNFDEQPYVYITKNIGGLHTPTIFYYSSQYFVQIICEGNIFIENNIFDKTNFEKWIEIKYNYYSPEYKQYIIELNRFIKIFK